MTEQARSISSPIQRSMAFACASAPRACRHLAQVWRTRHVPCGALHAVLARRRRRAALDGAASSSVGRVPGKEVRVAVGAGLSRARRPHRARHWIGSGLKRLVEAGSAASSSEAGVR